mmetsp:Transcript_6610/g.8084  ORF Transcript_6610/g.8084 Transcript_6610/m.8084 type:complete len:145 (+) Transcript_6610:153-587(+)
MKRPDSKARSSSSHRKSLESTDLVSLRKPRTNFFKDLFGKRGPDPHLVNEWLPPFVEVIELQISSVCGAMEGYQEIIEEMNKFRMGTFDELGFFHSQLDDIPDSEAKKTKEGQIRAIEKDKEFAREVIRSIEMLLSYDKKKRKK